MSEELPYNLHEIVQDVAATEPESLHILYNNLVLLKQKNEPEIKDVIQQIKLILSEEGDISVATTLKIPNLKFQLGEFLLESTSSTIAAAGSLKDPIRLALVSIRFLQKIHSLATINIDEADAEILLAIYKLGKSNEMVSVDNLIEVLDSSKSEAEIAKSLETLEDLSCITLTMDEIILNETIIIRSDK